MIRAMQEGRVNAAAARSSSTCGCVWNAGLVRPPALRSTLLGHDERSPRGDKEASTAAGQLPRRIVLRSILPNRRILHVCFLLLRLYQRSGLPRLVRASGIMRALPRSLARMEALLLRFRNRSVSRSGPRLRRKSGGGRAVPGMHHAGTVRPGSSSDCACTDKNGISVEMPRHQTCCGALHLHDGDFEAARQLARSNIAAFEKSGAEAVIVNAAGCGAMLREYDTLLAEDAVYAARARGFSLRVRDIAEYLDNIGIDRNMNRLEYR